MASHIASYVLDSYDTTAETVTYYIQVLITDVGQYSGLRTFAAPADSATLQAALRQGAADISTTSGFPITSGDIVDMLP